MSTHWTDAQIEDAIQRSLAELKLDPVYGSTARRFLFSDPDEWCVCCESNCEPCVLDVARVIERARNLLETAI